MTSRMPNGINIRRRRRRQRPQPIPVPAPQDQHSLGALDSQEVMTRVERGKSNQQRRFRPDPSLYSQQDHLNALEYNEPGIALTDLPL